MTNKKNAAFLVNLSNPMLVYEVQELGGTAVLKTLAMYIDAHRPRIKQALADNAVTYYTTAEALQHALNQLLRVNARSTQLVFPPVSNASVEDRLVEEQRKLGAAPGVGEVKFLLKWDDLLQSVPTDSVSFTALKGVPTVYCRLSKGHLPEPQVIEPVLKERGVLLHISAFLEADYPIIRIVLLVPDNPQDPLALEQSLDITDANFQAFAKAAQVSKSVDLIIKHDEERDGYHAISCAAPELAGVMSRTLDQALPAWKAGLTQEAYHQAAARLASVYPGTNDGISPENLIKLQFAGVAQNRFVTAPQSAPEDPQPSAPTPSPVAAHQPPAVPPAEPTAVSSSALPSLTRREYIGHKVNGLLLVAMLFAFTGTGLFVLGTIIRQDLFGSLIERLSDTDPSLLLMVPLIIPLAYILLAQRRTSCPVTTHIRRFLIGYAIVAVGALLLLVLLCFGRPGRAVDYGRVSSILSTLFRPNYYLGAAVVWSLSYLADLWSLFAGQIKDALKRRFRLCLSAGLAAGIAGLVLAGVAINDARQQSQAAEYQATIEELKQTPINRSTEADLFNQGLSVALQERSYRGVAHALECGAAINDKANPPLLAVMKDDWNHEIINLLLEMEADVNLADASGETPLFRVCGNLVGSQRRELVDRLLKAGARPLMVDHLGRTAFDVLKQHQPDADTTHILLQAQANALIQAAARANEEGDSESQAKAMEQISTFGNRLSGEEMEAFVNALKAAATLHHLGTEFRIEKVWVPRR